MLYSLLVYLCTRTENSKHTNISLDQKTKDVIKSHMIFKYEDGPEETFFVWIEEGLEK